MSSVEIFEKTMLDKLTPNDAQVMRQKFVNLDGSEQPIGEPWRRAYVNSTSGRQQVQDEVPEPYLSAIFAVWGDIPTIIDPVNESPEEQANEQGSAE